MQIEAVSPHALATASVQRPRTNARVRPVSARISDRVKNAQGVEPSGPKFPIEAVMAWVLAATAVVLAWLIASI